MSLLGNITVSLSNTSTSSTGTISQTVAGGSLSNTTNLNGSSLTELSGNVTQITGQQINFGSTVNDTNINITGKINSSNDIITQGSFYSYSDERLKKNIHPIENTLDKVLGNVSKAAAQLGVSRETLHNKIRKYSIEIDTFRSKR